MIGTEELDLGNTVVNDVINQILKAGLGQCSELNFHLKTLLSKRTFPPMTIAAVRG